MASKKCYVNPFTFATRRNSSSSSDRTPEIEEGEILTIKTEHEITKRLNLNEQYLQYCFDILHNINCENEQTEPLDLTIKKCDDNNELVDSFSPNSSSELSVLSTDDLLIQQRKSWKSHFQDEMYICDICDKSFNKQSSLARHKYEHSGKIKS
jgi:hypothetical protein